MTRQQALEVAKENHTRRRAVPLVDEMLMSRSELEERFGYIDGWYKVGNHSFNLTMITGVPYDADQGGWAWV